MAWTKTTKPKLLLAKTYTPGDKVRGWFASEKMDGIRVLWNGRHLITRGGCILNPPQRWLTVLGKEHIDGELWAGRTNGPESVMAALSRDEWSDLSLYPIDRPKALGTYLERLRGIRPKGDILLDPTLHQVLDDGDVQYLLKHVLSLGGEGLVLRAPHTAYHTTRSPFCLKVKPWLTMDATVSGYRKRALEVTTVTGHVVGLSSGLSNAVRDNLSVEWPIGARMEMRYSGMSKAGTPKLCSLVRRLHDGEK